MKRLPNVARRHVTLLKVKKHGKLTFRLIGPDGQAIPAFDVLANNLLSKSFHTRKSYCTAVADFYDYYFEACHYFAANEPLIALTRSQLDEVLESWRDYLVFGCDSGNELAREVDRTLPSPRVLQTTADTKHSALKKFHALSEKVRRDSSTLVTHGLLEGLVDQSPLLSDFGRHVQIGSYERSAMIHSSVKSGVLAVGACEHAASVFVLVGKKQFDRRNIFPLDDLDNFCSRLSARDQAIHYLEAASGCRSHEGMQILWEDIDFENRTVKLVDPNSRPNHPSYLALTVEQRNKLAWKGRNTSKTFLIEPFRTKFFEALEKYHRDEYIPHGRHDFVFQITKKGKKWGDPYFTTDTKTRQDVFNRARDFAGISEFVTGVHSLRHSYGTYLLNYYPLENGEYGLPIATVKELMGHKEIDSTEIYAIRDQDLLEFGLKFANTIAYNGKDPLSQSDLKLLVVESEIRKLQAFADTLKGANAKYNFGPEG